MATLPHFSYPFRFKPPAAVSEQDSVDEIADCCAVILLCPFQFRVELPEFGLPDPTFQMPIVDVGVIRTVVERWEQRASLLLDAQPDQFDELLTRVQTLVQVRSEE
jgi:hypothetical protein